MPNTSRGAPVFVAGRGLMPSPMANVTRPFVQPSRYVITGVTKDAAGAALGGCTVEVFEVAPGLASSEPHGMLRGSTVSDASGNYALDVTTSETGLTFQVKAYLAGSPDVAGVTVNTLVGMPT